MPRLLVITLNRGEKEGAQLYTVVDKELESFFNALLELMGRGFKITTIELQTIREER